MKYALTLFLLLVMAFPAVAEEEEEWSIWDVIEINTQEVSEAEPVIETENVIDDDGVLTAREDFIERIIALGKELYIQADGKSQRAHYKGDIYVCKNFTVHLFRENRDDFCIAEYPDVELKIPNNLSSEKCKPYYYGFYWEDVDAADGNPFYEAAAFRYDTKLSKEENLELAMDFMRQVQRGDYFQMAADYYYGVGAHSAIMIADWNPETDTVRWMDSNMAGKRINGVRHGYVQFDREKSVTWWAEAFCHKRYGATIYRLRDNIVYAD